MTADTFWTVFTPHHFGIFSPPRRGINQTQIHESPTQSAQSTGLALVVIHRSCRGGCRYQWGSNVGSKERKRRQEACALHFLSEGLIVVCQRGPLARSLPPAFGFTLSLFLSLLLHKLFFHFLFFLLHCWHVIHIWTFRPSNGGGRIDRENPRGGRETERERERERERGL